MERVYAELRLLVEAAFDLHASAPCFIRLVMIENIHSVKYLRKSEIVPNLNRSIIDKLEDVCARGKRAGLFRQGAEALKLHWMISAFSFYNVSNKATFSKSFGENALQRCATGGLESPCSNMVLAAVVIGHDPKPWG